MSRLLRFVSIICSLVTVFFAVKEWQEWRVFRAWVVEVREQLENAPTAAAPEQAFALSMMKAVHQRLSPKLSAMTPEELQVPGFALRSSVDQLNHPSGACTSFSQVLTKCLLTASLEVRKVGLMKGGNRAIHHVIEAKLDGRWVLLDPLFDQSFRSVEGNLSGAAEVGANWSFYRQQVPPHYPADYDYSGFYYTNWEKIPIVGRMVKADPVLEAALKARGVSVRLWVFNLYRWAAGLALLAALFCWWLARRWQRRATVRP